MNLKTFFNRLIVIGFMVIVGYCLAKSVSAKSVVGIILALVSLGAGVYFLYLLAKAQEECNTEETT